VIPRAVLAGEPRLEDLRWALAGREPRRAIAGAIDGLLERGAGLAAIRILRVKFKPGRKLTVHYDARVRRRGRDEVRPVVAVWREDGEPAGAGGWERLEAEARAAGLATPFRALHAPVPGLPVTVKVAPLDPALPELLRLSDPRHVGGMPRFPT